MLLWIIIKVALQSLWSAKLRSFLAILGIIMGVGAVIAMLSIVEGAREQMKNIIGGLGTNVLIIWPDYRSSQGKGSVAKLRETDPEAILAAAPDVLRVSPEVSGYGVFKNGNRSVHVELEGIAPTYLKIRNISVEKGRPFTDAEVAQDARVLVLGPKTAEKLFGTQDPLEQIVKVNLLAFRVVGILKSTGGQGFGNGDNRVLAPFTTVQREVVGRHADLSAIDLQAVSTETLLDAEHEARLILRKTHQLKPAAKDDFGIFNQAQLLESEDKVVRVFSIVLGGVGGICLFTGGIGIMNIMLVIVTERTREIGVRKALGAKNRDVLRQFLLEAVLISVLGGVIGIGGGMGLSLLIRAVTPLKTAVSANSVMISLGFATGIGIFFGLYPAMRAAKLDPIEALARE